jgi:hypothetical protein
MTTDQNDPQPADSEERRKTQLATLRKIYHGTHRREHALLFIHYSPASEKAMLMEEFEHLEMMHEAPPRPSATPPH